MTLPSLEELSEHLRYEEETGHFYWIKAKKKVIVGNIAGCSNHKGYVRICINYQFLLAHRLAWLFHYGEWPEGELDHINRDPSDNRISNLRLASRSMQLRNRESRGNTTGYRGVKILKNNRTSPFRAQVQLENRQVGLGNFSTPQEAARAYDRAILKHFGPDFPTNANLGLL